MGMVSLNSVQGQKMIFLLLPSSLSPLRSIELLLLTVTLSSFVPICLPPLGNGIGFALTPRTEGIGLARVDAEAVGFGFGFFVPVVCPSSERLRGMFDSSLI